MPKSVPIGKRRPIRSGLPTQRTALADIGTWHIPPDLNPHEVIDQYLTESTTSQIAKQYGVSRKALTKWLRETLPNEWRQAQVLRALCLKEDSEEGIGIAENMLSLARSRELLKSAQFDLTSLDPDYRPKQDITITERIDLQGAIQDAKRRVLTIDNPPQVEIAALLPAETDDPADV